MDARRAVDEVEEGTVVSQSRFSITRRHLMRVGAAAGSLSLAGMANGALASGGRAVQRARRIGSFSPFANGIDPVTYVGGDGSYAKYQQDGIRLGLIEAFPVNYVDKETGKRTGWNTDLVLAALDKCGITKIEYVEGPWESMVPGLQSSRFDLLASDVHVTPERIEIIDFSAPVFWYGDIVVVPKGNPADVHSWDGLAGKTVGVALGVNYADWLQARTDLKELRTYKDNQTAVADLVAGRLDAYVAEDANFTGFFAQNKDLPIEIVADYVPKSELSDWTRFGIRKEDRDFNNVFSRAIAEMYIDGTTLSILKKYGLGERNLFAVVGMV
ncbi:MAG: polar amino acid transport system substrate-binding protein [Thermomicrobiales bacterium]|nr:polar amino acid transport system substrate-binding protein [Thermomicrobiales bacterium]